jgi:hypothetical protein
MIRHHIANQANAQREEVGFRLNAKIPAGGAAI